MTLSSDNATSGSGITNRRRFIGGTAAAATGLWAAPKVMATAAAPACSTAPRVITLTAETECGPLSSETQPSGPAPQDSFLFVVGCSSCAGGNVIVRISSEGSGNEPDEIVFPATGTCTDPIQVAADYFFFTLQQPSPSPDGTVYVLEAFFEDDPSTSTFISWVLSDCVPT